MLWVSYESLSGYILPMSDLQRSEEKGSGKKREKLEDRIHNRQCHSNDRQFLEQLYRAAFAIQAVLNLVSLHAEQVSSCDPTARISDIGKLKMCIEIRRRRGTTFEKMLDDLIE